MIPESACKLHEYLHLTDETLYEPRPYFASFGSPSAAEFPERFPESSELQMRQNHNVLHHLGIARTHIMRCRIISYYCAGLFEARSIFEARQKVEVVKGELSIFRVGLTFFAEPK